MIIVFVIDNYGALTNGTTITAYRFREALEARGHTVRVVGVNLKGENMFSLKENYIPLVTKVARRQSTYFGKPEKHVLQKAFEGADVVHFFHPWNLSRKGRKIAHKMGIPTTAAFHTQPENITYGMGLGKWGGLLASFLYHNFKRLYKHFDNIHCPSLFIADELKKHNYHAKLHVISNGISSHFQKLDVPKTSDKFKILMIGRFSKEKRHDLIIEAVKQSKYEKNIQIYFAGKGPLEKKVRTLAKGLTNEPIIGFYTEEELINLINQMDLYVHAADVEIEAIACLEAFACGVVPVIANAKKSATKQFALDDRSLFTAGKAKSLTEKIEYWIEHPEEREKTSDEYVKASEKYRLDYSIDKAEEMFKAAIHDHEMKQVKEKVKKYDKRVDKGRVVRSSSFLFYYGLAMPLLWVYKKAFLPIRFENKKYLKEVRKNSGAITVCNHVHTLDAVMAGFACFPKKPIFTSLKENFEPRLTGSLVSILGSVPTPETINENRLFFYHLSKELRDGRFVHFYPEGELIQFDSNLRPFKRGAFYLAVDAQVPIVPMIIQFKENEKRKRFRKHYIEFKVGKPIYPNRTLLKKEAVEEMFNATFIAMQGLMEESIQEVI